MEQQSFPQICWRTKYAAAFMDGDHMVIRYRFPYSTHREAALLGAYHLHPNDRMTYYRTLGSIIERNLQISDYFKDEAVPSVLTYTNAYQQEEDGNIICIYCIPSEPITPISQALFSSDCNALTAFNVFLRLAHILRDIHKTPISPVLRYLDMDEVYLTAENKILLGGFYYASAEGLPSPPQFLPDAALGVLPDTIREGALGDSGTDMQTLAQIAWNIFSGLPWNCEHTATTRKIPPCYAPPQLLQTLEFGLTGNPANFNAFRKQLLQCHKELAKSDFATLTIPMQQAHKKQYFFNLPDEQPAAENKNGAT